MIDHQKKKTVDDPLKMWNKIVRRTTRLTIEGDLRDAYHLICKIVNKYELNGQLSKYPQLLLMSTS